MESACPVFLFTMVVSLAPMWLVVVPKDTSLRTSHFILGIEWPLYDIRHHNHQQFPNGACLDRDSRGHGGRTNT